MSEQPQKPLDPSHIESRKREYVVSALDRKSEQIVELDTVIHSFAPEDSHEEVAGGLNSYVEKINQSYSEKEVKTASRGLEIQVQIEDLKQQQRDYLKDKSDPMAEIKAFRVLGQINDLKAEQEGLISTINTQFLSELYSTVRSLKEKNKKIQNWKANGQPFGEIQREIDAIESMYRYNFPPVKKVTAGTFDIVIDVEGKSVLKGYSTAFNIDGTHLIFMPADVKREDYEFLLGHERVHNYLGASTFIENEDTLQGDLEMYKDILHNAYKSRNEAGIQEALRLFKDLKPDQFMNMLHEEILGNVGRRYGDENILTEASDRINRATGYLIGLQRGIGTLLPDTLSVFQNLQHAIEQRWAGLKEIINHIEREKDSLSTEEQKKINAMFFILKPTQYHHILTYIESKKIQ